MIDNLLTTGQSSRLYRSLVDGQQLAVRVNTSLRPTMDESLFEVTTQPRKGIPVEKLEQAIYTEMTKLATDGPAPDELQKAKNQAIAAYYRSLRSIAGRAETIGEAQVIFGDYHSLAGVEGKINAITTADIQRVMKQYLKPTNRTVAILIPTDEAPPAAGAETKKGGL